MKRWIMIAAMYLLAAYTMILLGLKLGATIFKDAEYGLTLSGKIQLMASAILALILMWKIDSVEEN